MEKSENELLEAYKDEKMNFSYAYKYSVTFESEKLSIVATQDYRSVIKPVMTVSEINKEFVGIEFIEEKALA